jgi:heme A synthase
MQPTLFTATYSAGRAAETPPSPRSAARVRMPRKAAAGALAALALAGALVTAGDAHSSSSTGPVRHSDFRSAIVSPGQFGWQAHCPHTGPAPR